MGTWQLDGRDVHEAGGGIDAPGMAPGKRTLTSAIQRRERGTSPQPRLEPVTAAAPLVPHEDPFWFADAVSATTPAPGAVVQRRVTIDGDDGETDHESISQGLESIMLGAPVEVRQAYQMIDASDDVELIVRFDPDVEGYGHTVIQGRRIWITLSDDLMPVDGEDGSEGEDQQFQNVDNETELEATLIHEFVLHVMPALPSIFQGQAWESDEDTEHGVLGGWATVLRTAAAVNPTVLRNSIVDALKHLHHLGADFTALCEGIQVIGDQHGVTLDWRVIGGVPYEVHVGSDAGEIRLVRQNGELVEAEEDEDPVAHGHDFIPLGQDVDMDEGPAQLKVEIERAERRDDGATDGGGGGGLPAELRGGLEEMSGFDLGGVTVQRNSAEPARMNARAFARGNEIHLGPGNEGDLAHEAWHVVQQLQGRVATTTQHAGAAINDDPGLEHEADEMGARAVGGARSEAVEIRTSAPSIASGTPQLRGVTMPVVQEAIGLGSRVTAEGNNPQQTFDDMPFTDGVICHYSARENDPADVHISFYPADDREYKKKILHYKYRWDANEERFVGAGQVLETWKPYAKIFAQFKQHADALMDGLRQRIVTILGRPQVVHQQPVLAPMAFVHGGTMVRRDDDMGYQDDLQKPVQYKREAGAVAPVVQRIVYDADDNEACATAADAYDLIAGQINTTDKDAVLRRIQALIDETQQRYSTVQVIADLVNGRLATRAVEMEEDDDSSEPGVEPDDRNLPGGRKSIGGQIYTPTDRGFRRGGDEHTWRVKDNLFQRGNAETEFLGGLLYAALVGQHGAAELHYHGDNPYGLIVKQDLPDFRIWASGMDDFAAGNYDAQGLGRIAVAAWFLGEHDMHTANFGTVDNTATPQVAVVDPSGALHPENLERDLDVRDLRQLPLPPQDWTHSGGGWQLHDRSAGATPDTRQLGLSQPVKNRMPAEKMQTVQRILQLDLGAVTAAIGQRAFLDGAPLGAVPQERRATLPVLVAWLGLLPTLQARRQQVAAIVEQLRIEAAIDQHGLAIDQHIQNRPQPPPPTAKQETEKFWK